MPQARRSVALAILSAVIVVLWTIEHLTNATILPHIAWVYPIAALVVTVTVLWFLAVTLERMKARSSAHGALGGSSRESATASMG